jgi:hypothetical protein
MAQRHVSGHVYTTGLGSYDIRRAQGDGFEKDDSEPNEFPDTAWPATIPFGYQTVRIDINTPTSPASKLDHGGYDVDMAHTSKTGIHTR